jgi:hypothetical protein
MFVYCVIATIDGSAELLAAYEGEPTAEEVYSLILQKYVELNGISCSDAENELFIVSFSEEHSDSENRSTTYLLNDSERVLKFYTEGSVSVYRTEVISSNIQLKVKAPVKAIELKCRVQ